MPVSVVVVYLTLRDGAYLAGGDEISWRAWSEKSTVPWPLASK